MEPARRSAANPVIAALGTALTGVAGYVDAVGYLRYFHIFSANMSGNHIRLGIALEEATPGEMVVRFLPIVAFGVGVVISELITHGTTRMRRLHAVAAVWVLEAAMLAGVAVGDHFVRAKGGASDLVLLALLALAMGMQNTSLRHMGALSVYTTHVTGALTAACIDIADGVHALVARHGAAGRGRAGHAGRYFGRASWLLTLPICYVGGAAAGAAMLAGVNMASLGLPSVILVVLAVFARAGIRSFKTP